MSPSVKNCDAFVSRNIFRTKLAYTFGDPHELHHEQEPWNFCSAAVLKSKISPKKLSQVKKVDKTLRQVSRKILKPYELLEILFGHPNWTNVLYSDICLSLDNLSLFAIAKVCVGLERSELIASVSG